VALELVHTKENTSMQNANSLESPVPIKATPTEPTSEAEPPISTFSFLPDEYNAGDDTTERIRKLAYALYEEGGRVDGRDLEYWLEAESIIRQGGKIAA
jgi:hypothetical protein